MVQAAETRYARTPGGTHLAYQVAGDGPLDLVEISNGTLMPFDATGEQSRWQAYVERLAAFSRLIRFDLRGMGLSDPIGASPIPIGEEWAADALAVLDAAGSGQAAVVGVAYGAEAAILLTATHPERVRALVLVNAFARLVRAPDYPAGVPARVLEWFRETLTDPQQESGLDDLPLMVPSLAQDAAFRAWWRNAGRRGASPAAALAIQRRVAESDVRSVLPNLRVPTLVLHSRDDAFVRVGHGRYLAGHIPGARLVELQSADHVPWASDADFAGEMEEFLTGARHRPPSNRLLAAVVFTDIVGSTEQAAALGDGAWRERLDQHDRLAERQIDRFGGRLVKSTGDGVLATFDGPARAIECACAIRDAVRQVGIEVRAGVHMGEVEVRGDDVAGIAVHLAQRICGVADAGEVLASRTLVDLVAGSAHRFDDRGEHELKGVPGSWRLFGVLP